jgi:hypothetical protein
MKGTGVPPPLNRQKAFGIMTIVLRRDDTRILHLSDKTIMRSRHQRNVAPAAKTRVSLARRERRQATRCANQAPERAVQNGCSRPECPTTGTELWKNVYDTRPRRRGLWKSMS